ncbi:hypothetical protein CRE_08875 [Caenorhabditis remanei]|uniref:ParB/Sulfiredoxin domain-containing protein n=1 Tax=Caenorhabditis remanei TaxID=31234 RepID=E3LI01_CAERE|nr:hypothetical protein CRE_08875 [Caenorhabditis remanei]
MTFKKSLSGNSVLISCRENVTIPTSWKPSSLIVLLSEEFCEASYEKIYVGGKCLRMKSTQLEDGFRSESFFMENLMETPDYENGLNFDESPELGESYNSSYHRDTSHNFLSSSDDESEMRNVDEGIRKVAPITTSALDQKLMRERELEQYKTKLDNLLQNQIIPADERVVDSIKLVCTKMFPEDDEVIQNMSSDLNSSICLKDSDPIVVVSFGEKYNVVSGNRRATAYQKQGVAKVRVSKILEKEAPGYRLNQFFFPSKKKEATLFESVDNFKLLFQYLDISQEQFTTWKGFETYAVFGSHFGCTNKISEIFRMFRHEELVNAIMKHSDSDFHLSAITIRNLTRKFVQNPASVIQLVNRLKGDEEESVIKKEKTLTTTTKQDKTTVAVLTSIETPTSVVTDQKEVIHRFLSLNDDALGLLFGLRDEERGSSTHTLLVPDEFSLKDEFGCHHNHLSLTVYLKKDGKMISKNEVGEELAFMGVSYKTILTTADVQLVLSSQKDAYIEINETLLKVVSKLIKSSGFRSFVKSDAEKEILESYLFI